ncbi:MAG: DUF262 and DUF1524 domain-containing protein [Bacteroidales bacterium]
MKASETRISLLLSKNSTKFVIPVYQRNYDWSLDQCKQLFYDIEEVGNKTETDTHFIGSIVYVHDDIYSANSIAELTIIDGQQRLTTITLMYIAIYRLLKDINDKQSSDQIFENFLINKFDKEVEKLKLKPTENNKDALQYIINSNYIEDYNEYSRIIENFNYFRKVITVNNYKTIQQGLSKLVYVDIALDRQNDNPQRIFESLNSTGLDLSQADLIRNYILMGLIKKDQDEIYKYYWEFIEAKAKDETLNKTKISDFIRDFLTLKNKEIPNKSAVYSKFKTNYPITTVDNLKIVLDELKSLVRFYNKLINPKNEQDKDIRKQLEYINRLEINVAFPFLMKVYEDYSKDIIDKITFIAILELVQSFTFRRFIVGLQTSALNKLFMSLYDKIEPDNYMYSLQKYLMKRSGSQKFPRDTEVINALNSKDSYNVRPKNRTYLLERLENYNNNENVVIEGNSNITIEHIFPQNPDEKWKEGLEEDEYVFIKETYLNTIGNLTLSGNNGALSNKSFLEKRDMNKDGMEQGYSFSRLWLNRDLKELEKWDKEEIEKRAKRISERFIKIWEIPNIQFAYDSRSEEVNIFDAESPAGKRLEYAIFLNKKLEVETVSALYVEVIRQLFELKPETFFSTELKDKLSLTDELSKDYPRAKALISDKHYIDRKLYNEDKFERLQLALTIFGFEDELFIKYKEEDLSDEPFSEEYHLEDKSDEIIELYNRFKYSILNLADDIEVKAFKWYIAFKLNGKNIFDITVQKNSLVLFVNVKKGALDDPKNLMRDVSKIGCAGNGDYDLRVSNDNDLEYIMSLAKQAIR